MSAEEDAAELVGQINELKDRLRLICNHFERLDSHTLAKQLFEVYEGRSWWDLSCTDQERWTLAVHEMVQALIPEEVYE